MKVLFDTNILARAAQPGHPMHAVAVDAGDRVRRHGHRPCLVPQVLYEFWVVCTRPRGENGLGLAAQQAAEELSRFSPPFFEFLDDKPGVFAEWKHLVAKHDVAGKATHDARLAAVMRVHGIEAILTFDTGGFARFAGIQVLDPREASQVR